MKRCYSIDKIDRRKGIHLSYTRTGEPTQAPVSAFAGRPRMRTDIESQIKYVRMIFAVIMKTS